MTKFGKSEKTGLSGLLFQNIQFQQFQSKPEERVKLEDLKIQGVLKQEIFLKGIKRPRWKQIKQEVKVIKIGPSSLLNWTLQFFQNR
jgi:hypothetical protein